MRYAIPLVLAACASTTARPTAPAQPAAVAACAPRGGTLAISSASGVPLACRAVTVVCNGARVFAGESDDRGLVAAEVPAGQVISVEVDGAKGQQVEVLAPFGGGAPIAVLPGGSQLWVAGEGGRPLAGVKIDLFRGQQAVFSGTTTALGALSGAPADLQGLTASGADLVPAPVDPATRTVVLSPKT